MNPVPHPPYLPNLAPSGFFVFPQIKKLLERKHFADLEQLKQKKAEALNVIRVKSSKTVLSNGKKVLIGVLHQMDNTLKVTQV